MRIVSRSASAVVALIFVGAMSLSAPSVRAAPAAAASTARLVLDIAPGDRSSQVGVMTQVGDALFFVANDHAHGKELWRTDGTTAGTVMVKDIWKGSAPWPPYPSDLTAVGGVLYFAATDRRHGRELWKSDGTEAGTAMVKDIWPGSDGSGPDGLTDSNGTLFFAADDGIHGLELWRSDGTDAGTFMVKDIWPGPDRSFPNPHGPWYTPDPELRDVDGMLYLAVNDGTHGWELWRSDGTETGTAMVKDIWPGPRPRVNPPGAFTDLDGRLYFQAIDHARVLWELWKSDGTEAGTVMLKPLWPGGLTAVGDTLYFTANDDIHGDELWKSDGTEAGTVMVQDIWPGSDSSRPGSLVDVGGTLYFSADDDTHGDELWKSDGTEAGTVMVKDIVPGSGSSTLGHFATAGSTLCFQASDDQHGAELWKSDGTRAGTVRVVDVYRGEGSSDPLAISSLGGSVLFIAYTPATGRELWSVRLDS